MAPHSVEVLAGAQLCDGEGDTGSLSDPHHHYPLAVLHQKNLLEADLLCLLVGGCELLL